MFELSETLLEGLLDEALEGLLDEALEGLLLALLEVLFFLPVFVLFLDEVFFDDASELISDDTLSDVAAADESEMLVKTPELVLDVGEGILLLMLAAGSSFSLQAARERHTVMHPRSAIAFFHIIIPPK